MPRKALTGPSSLSQLVSHLRAPPRLGLPQITSLTLTLAARNDHFGARHFLKEQLPRIRFANPDLPVHVRKFNKHPAHDWRPEIQLSFKDGTTQSLSLHGKWSTTIVRQLMDLGASPAWVRWKAEASRSGAPLIPGMENEMTVVDERPEPEVNFDEWRLKYTRKERREMEEKLANTHKAKAALTAEEQEQRKIQRKAARQLRFDADRLAEEEAERQVQLELQSKPQTGAAAILP
ncbi:L51-S25-CI-B8 domain-containing protein [Mycena indigotica]|uniref:L51-S25-CI-B8 domain-containing protein n=1 Tax=Mycena indigotica TaxID=2126181 RepID=A0A8H6WBV0_9AGAR|nr:L51-S25-CI-B8 domain-containing protein [Mycena indigotica]KAF7312197.1 L51-S25-CI-B8 domain-containing protein [Mycena indigotica]